MQKKGLCVLNKSMNFIRQFIQSNVQSAKKGCPEMCNLDLHFRSAEKNAYRNHSGTTFAPVYDKKHTKMELRITFTFYSTPFARFLYFIFPFCFVSILHI